MKTMYMGWAAVAGLSLAGPALSHGPANAGSMEHVVPRLSHPIANIPGKSVVAVEVNYPPGGASLPHRHASSAFIYAYVVSGSIRSQIEGQQMRIYKAGESFVEEPGAHHLAGGNASKTAPAKLLAVFVVDTADTSLTKPDN